MEQECSHCNHWCQIQWIKSNYIVAWIYGTKTQEQTTNNYFLLIASVDDALTENEAIFDIESDDDDLPGKKHITYKPEQLLELLDVLRPYSVTYRE